MIRRRSEADYLGMVYEGIRLITLKYCYLAMCAEQAHCIKSGLI